LIKPGWISWKHASNKLRVVKKLFQMIVSSLISGGIGVGLEMLEIALI